MINPLFGPKLSLPPTKEALQEIARQDQIQYAYMLQPPCVLDFEIPCDICGRQRAAGTQMVCMPSTHSNSDPWACLVCVKDDYRIAKTDDEYIYDIPKKRTSTEACSS